MPVRQQGGKEGQRLVTHPEHLVESTLGCGVRSKPEARQHGMTLAELSAVPILVLQEVDGRARITRHEDNGTNWYISLKQLLGSYDGANGVGVQMEGKLVEGSGLDMRDMYSITKEIGALTLPWPSGDSTVSRIPVERAVQERQ